MARMVVLKWREKARGRVEAEANCTVDGEAGSGEVLGDPGLEIGERKG
jgi:hypothetical protein